MSVLALSTLDELLLIGCLNRAVDDICGLLLLRYDRGTVGPLDCSHSASTPYTLPEKRADQWIRCLDTSCIRRPGKGHV